MRQRTISDFFWRDPQISDLTQEDKATLLYLLTSPSSNIIGVYQVVPRIAAAEMGWTADQLIGVFKRLQMKGLIDFIDPGWVWIKIWWNHNSAAGAFSPKLLQNAKKQCAAMPTGWLDEFLKALELVGVDRVSIGYPYPTDTPAPNTTGNTTGISISTTTTATQNTQQQQLVGSGGSCALIFPTTSPTEQKALAKLVTGLDCNLAQQILDEVAGNIRAGTIRKTPASLCRALVNLAKAWEFTPELGNTIVDERDRASRTVAQTKNTNSPPVVDSAHQRRGVELFPALAARISTRADSSALAESVCE